MRALLQVAVAGVLTAAPAAVPSDGSGRGSGRGGQVAYAPFTGIVERGHLAGIGRWSLTYSRTRSLQGIEINFAGTGGGVAFPLFSRRLSFAYEIARNVGANRRLTEIDGVGERQIATIAVLGTTGRRVELRCRVAEGADRGEVRSAKFIVAFVPRLGSVVRATAYDDRGRPVARADGTTGRLALGRPRSN